MDQLVAGLRRRFAALQDRFEAFRSHGVQVEGWFKGELIAHLHSSGRAFDREVRFGSRRVDFILPRDASRDACEIKSWLIGTQKGERWTARKYFCDQSSVGIVPDLRKLPDWKYGRRFLLIFCYDNPGPEDWEEGLRKFREKFPEFRLEGRTRPQEDPTSWYAGVIELV